MSAHDPYGRITFDPLRLLQAIGDGSLGGDSARVAAALLVTTAPEIAPEIADLTVDELIDAAKQIYAEPSLQAALDQFLAGNAEHGTNQVTVDLQ